MHNHFSLIVAALALLLSGCMPASVAVAEPVTLRIGGATSMRPVLQELTAEFSKRHPGVVFDLRGGDSTLAEQQVAEGRLVLGASTLMVDEEAAAPLPHTASTPLVHIPIAIDGVAVIVHASNPVANLTLQQLHDLFGGQIIDWNDLTGRPGEVLLVSREDGSGVRQAFDTAVMGDDAVALTAVVMPTSQDVVDFVGSHPNAIGYVSRAFVLEALARAGDEGAPAEGPVRVISVEGTLPTAETVAGQEYAFIQPLYLVSNGEPRGLAREFVDFVLSPAGQAIVGRYHVPVR
jgi:phosphate transport system substrate-binding protein